MKHLTYIVFLFCFVIFIICCRQPDKSDDLESILNIDLTEKYIDVPLILSDLSDDVRLVRLETNKNSLIPRFHGFVGEKYIISIDPKKVLQFSADGRYIRTIAIKGRGPGEFNQVDTWAVDDNEQFLFYHDFSKNHINKYNLKSGRYERKIPFEENGYLSNMLSVNDSTLAILPSLFSKYGYLYFYQSNTGRILEGIKKEPVPHPGAWAGMSPVFIKAKDNSILFQPPESDTIFRIKGPEMVPVISLIVEKPQKNGYKITGFYVSILYMDKDRVFLRKRGYENIVTPNTVSMNLSDPEFLFLNRSNNTLNKISSIYFDYLGIQLTVPSFGFPHYTQFMVQYQAMDFKKLLEDALKNGDLPGDKKNELKKLNSEISEGDNPVLITGKYKKQS